MFKVGDRVKQVTATERAGGVVIEEFPKGAKVQWDDSEYTDTLTAMYWNDDELILESVYNSELYQLLHKIEDTQ